MRVISWNMLFSNKRLDEALAYLDGCGADLVCLQEVPESFLPRLEALPYACIEAVETGRVSRTGLTTQYVAILSRFPITRRARIPLPPREEKKPLRTRAFEGLMVRLGIWGRGVGARHLLIADVETPAGPLRVFNIHLPLHRAEWRFEEFELAMMNRYPAIPAVVCGDFNTLESRRGALLSWFLGGTVADSVRWREERLIMEERFVAYQLANPLSGRVTHPTSRSQLDHILCSKEFAIRDARVDPDRRGSDHHPIMVALDHI